MASQGTKKIAINPSKQVESEAFYREAMEREKRVILDQLKFKARLQSSSPLLRTMFMDPNKSVIGLPKIPGEKNLTPKINYVNDEGGNFMLSRGPLPSSIPGMYNSHNSKNDWTSTEKRYKELKNELKVIDGELESKKEFVANKLKAITSELLITSPPYALPSLSTQAGAAILGSGFQWNGIQVTSNRTDYEWPEQTLSEHHSSERWGELTKGCNLPQKSLYLRCEPKKKPITQTL